MSFVSKLILGAFTATSLAKEWQQPEWLTQLRAKRETSNEDEHIYVHLINHTHDDVGWLKTVDEYWSGTNQGTQVANVHLVLDSVIEQLQKNPDRRFSYVEMKFFSMWWDRIPEETKEIVRGLVQNGQLEFLNAGWSMHDEACTHSDDMMNNMMLGNEWLERELGVKPRVAWSIDPFGHSNGNPRLLADMGFDAWFYARLDYEDKEQRLQDKSMNYIWRPMNSSLGDSVEIFTGAMRDHYCWIPGFWTDDKFDGDDPVESDETLETFNADYKTELMYNYVMEMVEGYQGNHMLVPMGCDFAFQNARLNFRSTDNLIDYFNSHVDNMTLLYSTPSMYLDSLKSQTELKWPVNYDDMFPYADQPEDYWTGYFTSRANAKSQVRFGQANLHASNKLFAEKVINEFTSDSEIEKILDAKFAMFDAMGVYQHHDGITGTAKQAVADDYTAKLNEAMKSSNKEYIQMIEYSALQFGTQSQNWSVCDQRYGPFTNCPIKEKFEGTFAVTMHNPATVSQPVQRIKVPQGTYKVQWFDQETQSLVDVDSNLECYTYKLNGGESMTDCNLFINQSLPANSLGSFQVTRSAQYTAQTQTNEFHSPLTYTGQNKDDAATFQFTDSQGIGHKFDFQMRYYNPATPNSESQDGDNCPSGAYIFKPKQDDQLNHVYSQFQSVQMIAGSFMHTDVLEYAINDATYTALVRSFKGSDILEFEVQMTGIKSHGSERGKEVVATWHIDDVRSEGVFFTDSNTLEMQERKLNFRPTFDLVTNEKVSGNYYPVNSAIAVKDKYTGMQMTVMNDRSQGGASLEDARVELMQNRRLFFDDYRGVEEALNERDANGHPIQVDAIYKVQIFDSKIAPSQQRTQQLLIDEPVQVFYSTRYNNVEIVEIKPSGSVETDFDGDLKIHMFPEARNQILIRLENISDLFDGVSNLPTFNVAQYAENLYKKVNGDYSAVNVTVEERTLSNNQSFQEWSETRYHWSAQEESSGPTMPVDSGDEMVLQPQRIRLFRVNFEAVTAFADVVIQ